MAGEIVVGKVHEQQDLDDVFETNKPFADETVERSLGRLGWLAARIRAEYMATISQLELTDAQRSVLAGVLSEAISDLTEFVEDGLVGDSDVDMQDSDYHPKQETLEALCDQIEDRWDESEDYVSPRDEYLGFEGQLDLGGSDSEVIIEIMERLAVYSSGETRLALEESD